MNDAARQAFEAVKTGDVATLRQLLDRDRGLHATRDENGISLIMLACYHRRADVVAALRELAGPFDAWEAAALGDSRRIAELARQQPEAVHAWSPDGFQPLHLAAFFGHAGTVAALLKLGADMNSAARNPMAVRPIHSAVASRNYEAARVLVEHGCDVNLRQHGGWTPLHAAALHGDQPLVELLLRHGADRQQQSDDGKTAANLAASKGHDALAAMLRSDSMPG